MIGNRQWLGSVHELIRARTDVALELVLRDDGRAGRDVDLQAGHAVRQLGPGPGRDRVAVDGHGENLERREDVDQRAVRAAGDVGDRADHVVRIARARGVVREGHGQHRTHVARALVDARPVLDDPFEERVDLVPRRVVRRDGERIDTRQCRHRQRSVHADLLEQDLLVGVRRPGGDVSVEGTGSEIGDHLLGWREFAAQHIVHRERDDGLEDDLALGLLDLVLVEEEELLEALGAEAQIEGLEFDRAGDVEQMGEPGSIDDEYTVDIAAGHALVHLLDGVADARHVRRDGDVAPVLPVDTAGRCDRSERPVPGEEFVGRLEFEVIESSGLEVGGPPRVADLDLAVVDGDLDPVSHQATLPARLGGVDERQEVAPWFVLTEHRRTDRRRERERVGLACRLVGPFDRIVESRLERREEPG